MSPSSLSIEGHQKLIAIMWKRHILSQANRISKKIMTCILVNIIIQAVVLTLFRPGESSLKTWVTSKPFKLDVWPPDLGDFSLKLSCGEKRFQKIKVVRLFFWLFARFSIFLRARCFLYIYIYIYSCYVWLTEENK